MAVGLTQKSILYLRVVLCSHCSARSIWVFKILSDRRAPISFA